MRRHFGSALLAATLFAAGLTLSKAYDECISSFTSGTDYFPEAARTLYDVADGKFGVHDASFFGMEYHKGFKVVNNHYSQRQYILYRCGAAQSDLDLSSVTLPTGYTRKLFSTPAKKVVARETTSLAFLQAIDTGVGSLGLADRLLSISAYTVDPCLRKAVITCTDSNINNVASGVSATSPSTTAGLNAAMTATDVAFHSTDVLSQWDATHDTTKTVAFTSTQEGSLLGRAEWIKFMGAFFNHELSANRYYNKVKTTYNALSLSAKSSSSKRPVVAFVEFASWDNEFVVSTTRLRIGAVEDAGGIMRYPENSIYADSTRNTYGKLSYPIPALNASISTNAADRTAAFAKIKAVLADVDVLIDETYVADPSTVTIANVLSNYDLTITDTSYRFIANKAVYRTDKIINDGLARDYSAGQDWLQGALVNPDVVLKDLIRIIHSDNEDVKGYTLTYLRDIFAGDAPVIKSASDCKSTYPICDASVSSYPIAPVCASNSYKKCSDGTTVTLTASSGCSKMAKCPTDSLSGGGLIALIVCMVLLGLAIIGGVTFFIRKQSAGGNLPSSPTSSAAINAGHRSADAI